MKVASPALLLLALAGCASRHAPPVAVEGQYSLGHPTGRVWRHVNPGGADKAWWSESLSATIYADSNCGLRSSESRLEVMTDHLLFGLTELQTLEEKAIQVGSRDALYRTVEGRMDGVPVRLAVVVARKDNCTYDFVYIARPDAFGEGLPDFLTVVEGFRTFRRN
jgi:hypothetical protein